MQTAVVYRGQRSHRNDDELLFRKGRKVVSVFETTVVLEGRVRLPIRKVGFISLCLRTRVVLAFRRYTTRSIIVIGDVEEGSV